MLKADDLSTSKNITCEEIDASQYDPNDKNMLKVDLSDSQSQYFKFTYTKPEDGTVYNTRQEGKEGALTGGITGNSGTINLAENAILNINDATVSGNDLTLEKDTTLAFNVNKVNSADSDVVTGVAGVSFTDETKINGYYVMPKAFVNATYDLQNDDNTTIVNLPNGGSYAIAQESNGKFGIETGVGVEMKLTDKAKVGLTYEYDWRDDYSAHTGLLNLKYAF